MLALLNIRSFGYHSGVTHLSGSDHLRLDSRAHNTTRSPACLRITLKISGSYRGPKNRFVLLAERFYIRVE
jgi:hypothetical protein